MKKMSMVATILLFIPIFFSIVFISHSLAGECPVRFPPTLTGEYNQLSNCVCSGVTPYIILSNETIIPGHSISLHVDSGVSTCPPYTWSVSGTGYTLDKTTTKCFRSC